MAPMKPVDKDSLSSSLPSDSIPRSDHRPQSLAHLTNSNIVGNTHKKRSTTIPATKPVPPTAQRPPVVKVVGTSKNVSKKTPSSASGTIPPKVVKPFVKPKPPADSAGGPVTSGNKDEILARLQSMAKNNNYYSLLGVSPDASKEELARARREVTAKLHPDHFTGDPEQQIKLVYVQ